MKRTLDGVTTLFTYDGWKATLEWDGNGNFSAWNVYGAGADEILCRYSTASPQRLRYHADRMGTIHTLLNDSGILERYTYDAFGQPRVTDADGSNPRSFSAWNNRFMFTGREWLAALGLYDYRNRFYHPNLGRFLQADPMGFTAGDANLFRYCGGDPVNCTDPSGLTNRWYAPGHLVNQSNTTVRYYTDGPNNRPLAYGLAPGGSTPFFRDVDSVRYNGTIYAVPGILLPGSATTYIRADGTVETVYRYPSDDGSHPTVIVEPGAEINAGERNSMPESEPLTLGLMSMIPSRPPMPTVNFGAGMGGTYLAAFQNFINGSAGHAQTTAEHNAILYLSSQNPPDYLRVPPQPEGEARPTRNVPGGAVNPASQAASVREWRDLGRRMRETHNFTRPDPHPQNYGYPGR